MLKYYIFAFIKANLLVFLIFGFIWLMGSWEEYKQYLFWSWLIINFCFQCLKINPVQAELVEDEWNRIRITEGKKWYDRYIDSSVTERLRKYRNF